MSTQQASYVTVDVFTSERLAGNQLAVIKVDKDHDLSPETKQRIAREFNFSETVFLHHDDPAQAPRADIYTPVNEMDFAGHPVIGTGHVLFRQLLPGLPDSAGTTSCPQTLMTKAGPVAIRYKPENQTVSAQIPHNIHIHSKEIPSLTLAKTQTGLREASLQSGFPVVSIVKGVTYALVDFTKSPDLFAAVSSGPSPTVDLDDGWEGHTLVQDLAVRMIAIDLEDPACDSGTATLASFLALQDGRKNGRYSFNLDQGSEIKRQSYITVEVVLDERGAGVSTVALAGQAALAMSGNLYLPKS
ncbi:phenazine biosynthesis-like protein [Penicillium capsulatum]|uniref:Phenazine biosynthesis-like protein n=1 Tax=Penicillium capsulatum TaxID=69766 RepID=A0A9W9IC87_9EURO|nr:phenazine biosynthesis-like protein [Penicillium capsulatum]KAJ6135271.1 phenazine biosynthesis-like protein [Penicillium capsulatum]